MSKPSNTQDLNNQSNVFAIAQRVGTSWRCLFASTDVMGQPTLVETIEVSSDGALSELLDAKQPAETYAILPGSATVCRTTTLPDVEEEQIVEALRLQAESKFLGGTREHRRAMAILDSAVGETNRVGLIVAWPESSTLVVPECLQDANFIPDAGAIAALLDGLRPTEPLLYADPADGTVTIALSHANGAALRATREDATTSTTFSEGIVSIARETATAHNHSTVFTESLVHTLQVELSTHLFDSPLLIMPSIISESVSTRIRGIAQNDPTWWSTWGILVGGLLAVTGTLQSLTTMRLHTPELNPSNAEKLMNRCDSSSIAMRLVITAVLLLAVGPAIVSGLKLSLLTMMNPDIETRYSEVVEARKQQIVYKELSKKAWPMTKIAADVINNVPVGIDIDMFKINVGEAVSIRGQALGENGETAPELIAHMQENLQKTGVFKDIQFSYESAGTYGNREFDLSATVVNPLKRPRYSKEGDFGLWTLAMRDAGLEPDEETDFVAEEVPIDESGDSSPLQEASREMVELNRETPSFVDDTPNRVIRDRPTTPNGGGSDAGSRSSDRNSGGEGSSARIPEPISAEQIALMSDAEARVALSKVAVGKKRVSRSDDVTRERLKNEMRMLLDRLKELAE